MPRLVCLLLPLVVLVFALPARAEDEESTRTMGRVDMVPYQAEPAANGPRLAVPPDMIASGGESEIGGIWCLDHEATWLPFGGPALDHQALGLDSVVEILRSTIAHRAAVADQLDLDASGEALILHGPKAAVDAASENVSWVLSGLAPSIRIDALLVASQGDGAPALRAMGGVHLWPGRWTRIYLQANELACTPMWDIETAQESTTMDPWSVNMPEGQELYARYHPGETVSLVEIWAGEVEHREVLRHDLSELRNVPEANGLGVVSYPRSSVNRTYTQVLLPAGERGRRQLEWTNAGVRSRLQIDIGAAPAVSPLFGRGESNGLALLRVGAVSSELEFQSREGRTDQWSERLSGHLYGVASAYEKRGKAFEFSVSPADGGEVFFLEAPTAELPAARALVRAAESKLEARQVQVTTLTVPGALWLRAVTEGGARVGAPIAADVLAGLREGGATQGESFRSPTLSGTPLGFRVGRSVPGIIDYDAELAQQAAGLHPETSARFAGLFGELRVRKTPKGHAVRLRGAYCWAHSEARAVEISVRPPVSMQGAKDNAVAHGKGKHLVRLPILSGGHAPIGREVQVSAGASAHVLMHALVRGEEAVLVLLTLE